ncbi:hypothetical protein QBC41DRAFT_300441 [Cercophora samala]|uniref:Uncharacterized protein n=1 Tax=Cercophora samala TaxID=330535 RepID=A0AA40DFB4_9PEZI|nr:hypothetical protein QBC41DRAFT_300441 [Cercophora samala]
MKQTNAFVVAVSLGAALGGAWALPAEYGLASRRPATNFGSLGKRSEDPSNPGPNPESISAVSSTSTGYQGDDESDKPPQSISAISSTSTGYQGDDEADPALNNPQSLSAISTTTTDYQGDDEEGPTPPTSPSDGTATPKQQTPPPPLSPQDPKEPTPPPRSPTPSGTETEGTDRAPTEPPASDTEGTTTEGTATPPPAAAGRPQREKGKKVMGIDIEEAKGLGYEQPGSLRSETEEIEAAMDISRKEAAARAKEEAAAAAAAAARPNTPEGAVASTSQLPAPGGSRGGGAEPLTPPATPEPESGAGPSQEKPKEGDGKGKGSGDKKGKGREGGGKGGRPRA